MKLPSKLREQVKINYPKAIEHINKALGALEHLIEMTYSPILTDKYTLKNFHLTVLEYRKSLELQVEALKLELIKLGRMKNEIH